MEALLCRSVYLELVMHSSGVKAQSCYLVYVINRQMHFKMVCQLFRENVRARFQSSLSQHRGMLAVSTVGCLLQPCVTSRVSLVPSLFLLLFLFFYFVVIYLSLLNSPSH